MISRVASTGSGSRHTIIGSTSMPTETKNSTAKASRSGSVSCAARCDNSDSARIMPAKNAPKRERDVEQHGGAEGDAERDRQHRQPEQFARAGMGDPMHDPGDHAAADHQHDHHEGRDLGERERERPQQFVPGRDFARRSSRYPPAPAAAPVPAPSRCLPRSASRPRCGRARSRPAGAPATRAAARRWMRPTRRDRTPVPPPSGQPIR